MSAESRRAWAWVEHLRAGGTATWADFDGAGVAADDTRLLPGAIQLEVARRLNEHGGRDDPAHRDLVDAVLAGSAPGRGQPDLELIGVHDGSRFGPPPADPSALAVDELVRMAVGVLADRALSLPPPDSDTGAATRRELPAAPWRRGYHLAGDPLLARHTRESLHAAGRRSGRRSPVAVVLADDLSGMLADVWTWRVQHRVAPSWQWWLSHWAQRDRLPPRLDLTAVAARWAGRVGPDRVHLVVGRPLPATLLGTDPGPAPRSLSADAGELLTRVNGVLRVLLAPAPHQRLLDHTVLPLLADERGARPGVPPRHEAWVRGRAERLVEELGRAGYPVHGDLASLLPRTGEEPVVSTATGVLGVALRALLRTRDLTGHETGHETAGAAGTREDER